ncbi:MAG: hypothetical protein GC159_14500 [Phycisphaera sp.]|nr:hypothetical protein [Phycisphaera sp.]
MAKFGRLEGGDEVRHDYGDAYFVEPCGSSSRLVIGPTRDHVNLLSALSAVFVGRPWFMLYVLLVPRMGHEPGRYQSPPFESHSDVDAFLNTFREYFEGDGRHHVWVGSDDGELLVYDQHDVIFAYGPLRGFESILRMRGFEEKKFWFPTPHTHHYLPENDSDEERLFAEYEWQYFPLQDGDEWD